MAILFEGTSGDDKYKSDLDVWASGDFEIFGYDGNDELVADLFGDSYYIYGGDGDDIIEGGTNYNYLYGGAGNDIVKVFWLADYSELYGGGGSDYLSGGDGSSLLDGGGEAMTWSAARGRTPSLSITWMTGSTTATLRTTSPTRTRATS